MKLDSKIIIGVAALAGIALAASSGMGGGGEPPASEPATQSGAQLPPGHPDISSGGSDGAASTTPTVSGVIEETIRASGYTYVRLTTDAGEIWAAGPETDLEEGAEIGLAGAVNMGRFESASLDRVFDPLYFTDRFVEAGAPAAGVATGAYTGTVLQVIPVDRYVYVQVEAADGTAGWLATEAVPVAEGDRITWPGGTMMTGFRSSTLERTFDEILFVPRLQVVEGS